MRRIELPTVRYTGADLLPELIGPLQERFGDARHSFVVLDLTRDPLPEADLLLCRDCLVHLSFADIRRALGNLVRSGIPCLLTTTFPQCEGNEEIVTGDWRPLDLERDPFGFPAPFELLNERCTEGGGLFGDKSLGSGERRTSPVFRSWRREHAGGRGRRGGDRARGAITGCGSSRGTAAGAKCGR
jgi:hypothetical protein